MIRICALWKKKDKDGKVFLTGKLGENVIFIFPNNFKKEDKHPDYYLNLSEAKKEDDKGEEYTEET